VGRPRKEAALVGPTQRKELVMVVTPPGRRNLDSASLSDD
jgi:hypothetical protein